MILPNIWKNKSHVPNHQPELFVGRNYPPTGLSLFSLLKNHVFVEG
jgi:hypothetical protein